MIAPRCAISTILALLTACSVHAASVERRGAVTPTACERATLELGGVRVVKPGGVGELIPWDDVRDVTGEDASNEKAELLSIATDVWRARSRVQRSDLTAARPLFEKHFERFRKTTSETALIVAEGLLRCRLASDDWMMAIVPALEVARLRRANIVTDRYVDLVSALDEGTLLCPQLAPAWTPDDRTKAIADQIDKLELDAATKRVASLYSTLLRGVVPTDEPRKDDSDGAKLLHAIARLEAGDAAMQVRAAKDLGALTKGLPDWARAWANHAVGRTALNSTERTARVDGVLALLRVAAQAGAPRRLTRASIDLAIPALRALGDAEGAAVLERERANNSGGAKATTPKPSPKPLPPPAPTGKRASAGPPITQALSHALV